MAFYTIPARNFIYLGTSSPEFKHTDGTGGVPWPVESAAFDAATAEYAYVAVPSLGYDGSSNIPVVFRWYAAATTGNVVFAARVAAITPDSDTQDVTTDSMDSEATATVAVSSSTNAMKTATVTVTAKDSLVAGDYLVLRFGRLGSDGSDSMAGDAFVVDVTVEIP